MEIEGDADENEEDDDDDREEKNDEERDDDLGDSLALRLHHDSRIPLM